MSDNRRHLHVVPMSGLIAEFMPRTAQMTADEWAERDAHIRAERETQARREAEHATEQQLREAREAGMPTAPATWRETSALRAVRDWDGDPGLHHVLVLMGGTGCGKSLAGVWWLGTGRRSHGRVPLAFVKAVDFVALGLYDDRVTRYKRARRLVLDDLGEEPGDATGFAASRIGDLIDARSEYGRPTVITTNAPRDRLLARYGARVTSRLARATWRNVHDADLRLPNGGK